MAEIAGAQGSGADSPSSRYEKLDAKILGEGTYGEVYKVKDQITGEILAMKRMKLHDEEEGIPSTAIREISILKELPHRNVVQLRDVFCAKQKVMLVFEFVESDLKKFMKKSGGALNVNLVRDFSYQLISGIDFLHNHRIIHRDLKPQNLLITQDPNPILKIADFGLARAYALPIPKYTHEVVTVWYRAPEILLGQAEYSLPVDIWSCGCIVAEMGCGAALFMGDCEIDTIFKIFQKLGTPSFKEWPNLEYLRDFKQETFPKWRRKPWPEIRDLGRLVGYDCCDLLGHLLAYDPINRCSAERALLHNFFK